MSGTLQIVLVLTTSILFGIGKNNVRCIGEGEEETLQEPVQEFLEEYFRWKLASQPLQSSEEGYHEYDGYLPKRSLQHFEEQKVQCEDFNVRSEDLLKNVKLSSSERHYVNQVLYDATSCVESFKFKGYLLADLTFMDGVQTYIPVMFSRGRYFDLSNKQGYENVLKRLEGVPTLLKDIQILLEMGIKENITLPIESLIQTRKQFEHLEVDEPTESVFFTHFKNIRYENATFDGITELADRAKMIIKDKVLPAFKAFDKFVHYTYLYHVRSHAGVLALPNGNAFYEECLKFFLTTSRYTAQQIHQIGLDEVKKLSKGVVEVGKLLGLVNMTSKEIFAHVNKDPEQYFEGTGALDYARDLIDNQIMPSLSQIFEPKLIDNDYIHVKVAPTPISYPGFAYYSADTFYFNIRDRTVLKRFELMTLILHESIPGHHLHIGVAKKVLGLPNFLKTIPDILPWSMAPSLTPKYGAYNEGWALYCEFLGHELGLYEDPYNLLGFYSANLLRAARLVVDTGIHHYGWTRDEVIEYLLETTAVSPSLAGQQANRYISWPGQATSYKLGEMVIQSIRADWEKELGREFNLAKFHTYLLSCYGALDTVEACMEEKSRENQATRKNTDEENVEQNPENIENEEIKEDKPDSENDDSGVEEDKETEEPKDNKDEQDSDVEKIKEVKEVEEAEQVKEADQVKQVDQDKETEEVKEAEEVKEVQEVEEVKEDAEVKEAEQVKEVGEVKEVEEVKEAEEDKEAKEVTEVEEGKDQDKEEEETGSE